MTDNGDALLIPHGAALARRAEVALGALGVGDRQPRVLRHRAGAAAVIEVDEVVVKVFEESHRDYYERERSAQRLLQPSGLVAELVDVGDLWIATSWCDLVRPDDQSLGSATVHRWLGDALVQLHNVDRGGLSPLPLQPRLAHWLAILDADILPPSLNAAIDSQLLPLAQLLRQTHLVHGDWGSSNVLVERDRPTRVVKVVDLEDARRGDPAEDFKWPLIEGPPWQNYARMAEAYGRGGGCLGDNAAERLVIAATDWCLDVLTWHPEARSPYAGAAIGTLDAFVGGNWPEPP